MRCGIPRRALLGVLAALWLGTACAGNSCGGCVTPLDGPFPADEQVYEAAQFRLTPRGLDYVEQNLVPVLDKLLGEGFDFDLPESDMSMGTLCPAACPVHVEIVEAHPILIPPATVEIDGLVDVDATITMSSGPLDCAFDFQVRDKPVSALVHLQVDPGTYLVTFDVSDIQVAVTSSDYDIDCDDWGDWLVELFKDTITDVMNEELHEKLHGTVEDLITDLTCLPCDFYASGCPAGAACDGRGHCVSGGRCLVRPQGMAGVLDLGRMYVNWDPEVQPAIEMLIAPAQVQQPSLWPLVRAGGIEMRLVGGAFADRDQRVPLPDPSEIPPTGMAPEMPFSDLIPGLNEPYMAGVAIADMYLDHLLYQAWRAGVFSFTMESDDFSRLNSDGLKLFIPSIESLTGGTQAPMRAEFDLLGVPGVDIGGGTFHPDGTIDEPVLTMRLPRFQIVLWVQLDGRWVRLATVTVGDARVGFGLEFAPDNRLVPVLDEDALLIEDVEVSGHELLAESPEEIGGVVKPITELFLPIWFDFLGQIRIVDLQGFNLDIISLQGNVDRPGTGTYQFMTIYADLAFDLPPPSGVETSVRVEDLGVDGFEIEVLDPDTEIQFRLDDGAWSPFRTGPVVRVARPPLPGACHLEVRARARGDYRTLDPTPETFSFAARLDPAAGTTTAAGTQAGSPSGLAPVEPPGARAGCATSSGRGIAMLVFFAVVLFARRRRVTEAADRPS